MTSSFRYVETIMDDAVNLFLFSTDSGSSRATVAGPTLDVFDARSAVAAPLTPMPLAKAFAMAIRMANRNDVEIVVSGDRCLWDADWGLLAPPK